MSNFKALLKNLSSIFIILLLELTAIRADQRHNVPLSQLNGAARRASSFILSARDSSSLAWQPKESAAAILGLTSADPMWRLATANSKIDKFEVLATTQGVKLAILDLVTRPGGVSGLDHASLSQFIGALQVTCSDPTDFYGRNLIAEAEKRVQSISPRSPAFGALVLSLCNARRSISESTIAKMGFRFPEQAAKSRCPFCVERAALNVLALTCLFRDQSNYDARSVFGALSSNLLFLERLGIEGREENLLVDALLIQALMESPQPVPGLDLDLLLRRVLGHQQPNGSFGDSVTFTASVLPVLTDLTALDIRAAQCEKHSNNNNENNEIKEGLYVHYEIIEAVTQSQSLVGKLLVQRGQSLLQALEAYQSRFPEIISFESEQWALGVRLVRLNSMRMSERQRVFWRIYRRNSNENNDQLVPEGLAFRDFDKNTVIVLKFQNV